jgi:hypothetical protein
MALFVPSGSIPMELLIAACVLTSACLLAPLASAQHVGHAGGGGHFNAGGRIGAPHAVAPPASHAVIVRPRVGNRQRPIFIRRRVFHGAPFYWFREGFYSSWWLTCGPLWYWDYGCNDWFPYGYTPENYVTLPPYQSAVYLYPGEGRDLVQLFLKDGTTYSVTDYWFVNDKVHFTVPDETRTKSVEQVIGLDELDLQTTIDVNTRRGFRVVMRNEPLEQYLRDHPDANAPLLQPPPKN